MADTRQLKSVIKEILSKHNFLSKKLKTQITKKIIDSIQIKKECCICYNTTNKEFTCKHSVCKSCMKKLNKLECPACRGSLKNLTQKQTRKILANAEKLEQEELQEREERTEHEIVSILIRDIVDRMPNIISIRELRHSL
jgi:hypothetical protein